MEYQLFRVEIENGIATVTFDRPPVNAQNRRSREELTFIFDTLSDRPDVRCVILTGSGKIFLPAADIKERVGISTAGGDYIRHNRLTREAFYAVADCAKPVIGALNGPAIGAGFVIAACCDILVAADDIFIQMPEIDVGLAGGAKFLECFPRGWARYIFFTGRRIPIGELHRFGVVQAVVPRESLLATAREIAAEIAAKSASAVQSNKLAFKTVEWMPPREGYRFEQGVTLELSKLRKRAQPSARFPAAKRKQSREA